MLEIDEIKLDVIQKDTKYIPQLIPKHLHDIIKDHKNIEYKGVLLKSAYLADIMYILINKYHSSKKLIFNLSSEILRSKYGTFYNKYVDFLLDNYLLFLSSGYLVGKKSKSYRLHRFHSKSLVTYTNTDRTLIKKYKTDNVKLYTNDDDTLTIDKDIRQKLIRDLYKVDINIDKANSIITTFTDIEKYQRNSFAINSISTNNIHYYFDEYGRFHTNFTTLKSEIRTDCLSINGSTLCELDINNSQPLFLCMLISDNPSGIDKSEYEKFKNLVFNNEFYSYYMSETNSPTKKYVKRSIYKVLFGQNGTDIYNKRFAKLFPTIFNFVVKYKKNNGGYKTLAHKLQRMESNFIFNSVIREFMEYNDEITLFTVHDSIIFEDKYKTVLSNIFNKNISNIYNLCM